MENTQLRKIFQPEELAEIDLTRVPKHVAVIPDGNRRWARRGDLALVQGHNRGAQLLRDVVQASIELGIKTFTLYSFSTENWRRSPEEVEYLMALLKANLVQCREELGAFGVRLETIGDLSRLPLDIVQLLDEAKEISKDCDRLTLVLAINYGSRDEICRTVRQMASEVAEGTLTPEEITEEAISARLDTAPWGDPELFIRTSGEMRVSNFLLWQLCYTEIYVTDVLWPDFSPTNLLEAVRVYQHRQKRFGV